MIAIIDYDAGNLFSAQKAFEALGAPVKVTRDPEDLRAAEKLVLPGVGAFGDCMEHLRATGLIPVIREETAAGKPLLGICVGLQILFESSEESPGAAGIGLLKGQVRKIDAGGLKVPHMGWNSLTFRETPASSIDLFAGLPEHPYVYFVHSYAAVPAEPGLVTAVTDYGGTVTAAVARGNILATQFHPEKSGDVGLKMLQNFVEG